MILWTNDNSIKFEINSDRYADEDGKENEGTAKQSLVMAAYV